MLAAHNNSIKCVRTAYGMPFWYEYITICGSQMPKCTFLFVCLIDRVCVFVCASESNRSNWKWKFCYFTIIQAPFDHSDSAGYSIWCYTFLYHTSTHRHSCIFCNWIINGFSYIWYEMNSDKIEIHIEMVCFSFSDCDVSRPRHMYRHCNFNFNVFFRKFSKCSFECLTCTHTFRGFDLSGKMKRCPPRERKNYEMKIEKKQKKKKHILSIIR